MYKQVIEKESQETCINIDYFGNRVTVCTNQATVMNRMERAGYIPKRQEILNDEIVALIYEFSFEEFPRFISSTMFKCNYFSPEQAICPCVEI